MIFDYGLGETAALVFFILFLSLFINRGSLKPGPHCSVGSAGNTVHPSSPKLLAKRPDPSLIRMARVREDPWRLPGSRKSFSWQRYMPLDGRGPSLTELSFAMPRVNILDSMVIPSLGMSPRHPPLHHRHSSYHSTFPLWSNLEFAGVAAIPMENSRSSNSRNVTQRNATPKSW